MEEEIAAAGVTGAAHMWGAPAFRSLSLHVGISARQGTLLGGSGGLSK